ncbi:MAG: S9 family peptidase, partial [Vicinamibacteria bacterium]|nr:S9 family peptidase [Vicinamibacteria bacterium]
MTSKSVCWVACLLFVPVALLRADEELQSNANLVAARTLARYNESRSARFAAWSPAAREMLILTRFAESNQAHLVRSPLGARRQMTFFPERVRAARYPRHDTTYFLFGMDQGGNEFNQIYRYDLSSGASTLLTDGQAQNYWGAFSRRGDILAYTSTRRNGSDRDIYLI